MGWLRFLQKWSALHAEAYLDIAVYTEILKGIENDGLYHSSVLLQDSIIK